MKQQKAFTLAEVLITLGVIGVVSAMTMPVLLQKYRGHIVETRLQNFYSMINQAIKMSELENGDIEYWDELTASTDSAEWYNKYLDKYIKSVKTEKLNHTNGNNYVNVYFSDGSLLRLWSAGLDFMPESKNFTRCKDNIQCCGKKYFPFQFYTVNDKEIVKGVQPYIDNWSGNIEDLTNGKYACSTASNNPAFCTKVIQINGWKIPKDYPFRF